MLESREGKWAKEKACVCERACACVCVPVCASAYMGDFHCGCRPPAPHGVAAAEGCVPRK